MSNLENNNNQSLNIFVKVIKKVLLSEARIALRSDVGQAFNAVGFDKNEKFKDDETSIVLNLPSINSDAITHCMIIGACNDFLKSAGARVDVLEYLLPEGSNNVTLIARPSLRANILNRFGL